MYDLGIWTYVIALTHFLGELFVFRGCKLNGPFMAPLTVAGNIHILVGVIFCINSYFGSFISHLASFSQGSICKILDTLVIYKKIQVHLPFIEMAVVKMKGALFSAGWFCIIPTQSVSIKRCERISGVVWLVNFNDVTDQM